MAFPALRNKCGTDKACILAAYKKQTAPLEVVIANVKTRALSKPGRIWQRQRMPAADFSKTLAQRRCHS